MLAPSCRARSCDAVAGTSRSMARDSLRVDAQAIIAAMWLRGGLRRARIRQGPISSRRRSGRSWSSTATPATRRRPRSSRGACCSTPPRACARAARRGPAVVPGKPDESLLIQAVRYDDELTRMPPKGKLPAADDRRPGTSGSSAGAPGRSATPATAPVRGEVPRHRLRRRPQALGLPAGPPPRAARRSRIAPGPGRPIDAFVLARLEADGLTPSPPADRRTLLRRAYYDLIGLPPTAEEIDGVRTRPRRRRLRPGGRSAARLAPLRRALGPALARRRPLCRHQGRRAHVRRRPDPALRLHLPRLRDPRLQRGHCPSTGSSTSSSPPTWSRPRTSPGGWRRWAS